MDESLATALARAFPDSDVTETVPAGPSWNPGNRSVRVEFADGSRRYLKLAMDGDGTRVARERAAIAFAARNCEVRTPTVVASDSTGPVPYLATAPMAGRPLRESWSAATETERRNLARRIGDALARVHAERFPSHGRIAGLDAERGAERGTERGAECGAELAAADLVLETGPWSEVLVATIEEMRETVPSARLDHHFDAVIAAVRTNATLLDAAPAALLHGDPAMPNCRLGADAFGFLDWELAHVGDPVRDLYRARDQQFTDLQDEGPEAVVSAFHDGYARRAGGLPEGYDERVPVYRAVRLLGASGFVERFAEYRDESTDELAAWIDAEMDRRLGRL
ncbi:MAG: phosphotransferase family protein [Halopenitus sp.]